MGAFVASLGEVYPRVDGGNSGGQAIGRIQQGLSPRGRGKLLGAARAVAHRRSIPAWTGETQAADCQHCPM